VVDESVRGARAYIPRGDPPGSEGEDVRYSRIGIAMSLLLLAVPDAGVAQWTWPERGENLQVLPEDFSAERLSAVMRGFTRALGVRCSHCHVGEEGAPLSTYDFVSDAKPNKERARAMYRMLGLVNRELQGIEPSGPERVNVWCHTCHQGRSRPQTLEEAVLERYQAEGGVAAVARFQELRERYYGGGAYDFTAPSVHAVARELMARGDTATARVFYQRNVEDYPDFAPGWEILGNLAVARNDLPAARRFYQRALALSPDNDRVRRSLDAIR
jgi:tetratricopeptide (TPR) repeat protein